MSIDQPYIDHIFNFEDQTMTTQLVLLGDYSNDQDGYNSAAVDGAVHVIEVDEASYSALYNVQIAVQATCNCVGGAVHIGIARDGKYIPLSVIEDTSINSDIGYQDLNEAFEVGLANLAIEDRHLRDLRENVDDALMYLSAALPDGGERQSIDHCIANIESYKMGALVV